MLNPYFGVAAFFALSLVTSAVAADPSLDASFTTNISPGITPDQYPSFNNGTGAVNAVALQSNGKILIGGNVSRYKAPAAGSPQTSLKRLNADGTLDTAFDALASTLAVSVGQTEINRILVTATDKIYVGGVFESYGGVARTGIMRLNADGTLDTSFDLEGISNYYPYGNRYVMAIAEQPDGKVLVGGAFNRLNTPAGSAYLENLVRLNSDGSQDTSFNQVTAMLNTGAVTDIAVLPNRQILVAGSMLRPGGGTTPLLKRLNEDGTVDASFSVSWSSDYGDIDELLVLPDGRIVIGGDFQFAGSSTHNWVACLNANGTIDSTFMANLGTGPNGWTGGELALQPDGTILAGGIFSSWNGQPRASIARLLPDGTLDNALAVQPYSTVHGEYLTHTYSFAVQPDGKIVMGGWFSRVTDPAVETYNLARLMNEYDGISAGALRLTSATARTTELESSITLPVSRFGGLNGAVGVSYFITAGSAVAGTDYTAVSGTLNWAAGEGGLKHIVVPLLPDATADGSRTFTVTLSSPTGGATLPAGSSSTVVTILDDEAPPTIVSSPQNTSLEQGGSFTLRVGYESVLAAEVQWQLDTGSGFSNIPAATDLTYTVNVADPLLHAGTYRAMVMNANGNSFSDAATVTISVPAGSVVTTFAPPADTPAVIASGGLAIDGNGRYLIVSNTGLRRLNADGTLEPSTSFGIGVSGATQVLALSDGRILLGGLLGTLTHQPSGTTSTVSTRLVRIKTDGTIDTYAPIINGNLFTLAAGAGGKYYVGSSVAAGVNGLQRFLGDGSVDSTFVSGIPTTAVVSVYSVKEQPDGKILVSYTHGSGGSTTYRLSRLSSTGALDTTFGTGGTATFAGTWFNGMDVLPDGRIAVSAYFNSAILTGQQQWVGLLSPTGVPDPGFTSTGVLNSRPAGIIYRDGRLLVWGAFTTVNGAAVRGLTRLNLDGTPDTTFSIGAGANNDVVAAQYTSTGDLFIAGPFTTFKGVARNKTALLVGNPHISALGFNPTLVTPVEDNAPLTLTLRRYGATAGAVSVNYTTVNGTAVADTDFNAASGTVFWADGDATDKTITLNLLDNATVEATRSFRVTLSSASGPAGPAAGVTVSIIDDDTPVSITTQPVASTSLYASQALALSVTATSPSAIAYQWYLNGAAIPGATSSAYNVAAVTAATSGVYHVRMTNAAGTYLSTPSMVFVRPQPGALAAGQSYGSRPYFVSSPASLAVTSDGGVLVGGSWETTSTANVPQKYLVRLNADGSVHPTFNLALNAPVRMLLRQPDGRILIGGEFTGITGSAAAASRLIRLNSDLTLDTAFNTAVASTLTSGKVVELALQPDGAVVVATDSGFSSGAVWRFTSAGAIDSGFGSSGSVTTTGSYPTALAVLPDGDIVAGGFFTNIASASPTKNRLARLNSNGTVDYGFTSGLGGSAIINDLLVFADGRLFAAGSNFANSATLALVNADGTFGSNMGSSFQVYQIAQEPGGKMVVARTNTTASSRIYRMLGSNPLPSPGSADGDSSFSIGTGPDSDARCLTIGPDGSIWVAGNFTTFNGVATGGVAKLNGDPTNPGIVTQPATTAAAIGDTAFFGVGASGTNLTYQWYQGATLLTDGGKISGATSAILTISNVSAGDVADYHAVVTNSVSGASVVSAAAHLHLAGAPVVVADVQPVTVDVGQTATLSATVSAQTPATYVWKRNGLTITDGGRFSGATTASLTITSAQMADTGSYTLTVTNSLNQATTAPGYLLVRPVPHDRAPGFATLSANQTLYAFHKLPDGRMLVGGTAGTSFTGGTGATSVSFTALAIVKADGSYDSNPGVTLSGGAVQTIARQSDGKWLIGGDFTSVLGVTRNRIARLNADFTFDTTFNPGVGPGNNAVTTIAIDTAGRIYVGGSFSTFDGSGGGGRQYLARLNADGTRDTAFTHSVSATVNKILALPDGGVLVGGNFFSPTSVIRLDASGTVVGTFFGPSPGNVNDLALAPDGTTFYVANGSSPYLQRRFLSDGAQDDRFLPSHVKLTSGTPTMANLNSTVMRIAVQADGKVVAAGGFSSPSFSPCRFLPTGGLDVTFSASSQVGSNNVNALVVADSGRIWLGGSFNMTYGSSLASRILVLGGDVPALAFASHPVTAQVEAGQTATFSAETVATTGVTYRWYKGGSMVLNGGRISGADTTTLTIANANVNDEGFYSLRATSATVGSIDSNSAELIFLAAPEMIAAPTGGTFDTGVSKTLTIMARGAATLSYQWFKGDATSGVADISGATSASYTLANPATTDTSYYGVRVTNSLGSTQSTPVFVRFASYAASVAAQTAAFNSNVTKLMLLADGSYLASGNFTGYTPVGGNTVTRRGIGHVLADGTADMSFDHIRPTAAVVDFARDSQGRTVTVGTFTFYDSSSIVSRICIARHAANGALDTAFLSPLSSYISTINCVAVDTSDRPLVGGSFTNFGGTTGANYLVRLDATTGARDTNFSAAISTTVNVVFPLPNNTMLVGLQGSPYLVRLTSTGAVDNTFTYNGAQPVNCITPVPSSTDYIIGNSSGSLQRITASGARVTPWPASGTTAAGSINAIQFTSTGKIAIGGTFTTYNGTTANRIALLNADGTLDTSFNSGTGFDNTVTSLALDSSNRLWVGGNFTTYRGGAASRVAILNGFDSIPNDPGAPIPPDPMADYLAAAGVPAGQRGATDDPDMDGLSNLLEYALDLPPNTPSAAGAPTGASSAPWFTLTYRRAKADVTYVVEQSDDLSAGSWTSVGVEQGTPQPDGTTTARIPLSGGSQFLRLSVSR